MPTMKETINQIVKTTFANYNIDDTVENRIAILTHMREGIQLGIVQCEARLMYVLTISFMILDLTLDIAYAPCN